MEIKSDSRKEFDERMEAFEKWYQEYVRKHDAGNPKKWKEFARFAFFAGVVFARSQSVNG